ncbi:MAG TPA: DAK2 domain-containing protein [Coriobacteriia bacterium]|nr:DAK2 domain-containing protein [Coriobacteriia bacterium]
MTQSHGLTVVDLIGTAADALKARKEEVNRLNVFPVPDGDTGTNMSLTMDAVMKDLLALPPHASLTEFAHAIAHGSLMGARGNSGVILSQILRGLCEVIGRSDAVSADVLSAALDRSVTVAFQAVRKPVEGTMLTVLKDVALAARTAVSRGAEVDEVLDSVVKAAYESVRRGPDLLPVLKEHNVVDAGGFGLAILAEGFVTALEGHAFEERDVSVKTSEISVIPVDDWDDDEYLYCTEFLLHGADAERSFIEERVASQGGSELVVGDSETYKVHVHTNDPAAVLAWATSLGEVAEVHINNMRRQTSERSRRLSDEAATEPPKPVGFVAVAAGSGLRDILMSLGADAIVAGGQTMNPSTAEILDAAQAVRAERVVILPNNRNIIMAAQQVIDLDERPIAVVPTNSVPEAFSALLAYDASQSFDETVSAMTEAASLVRTGEVTVAVKDAKSKAGPVKKGQYIGISNHEIEVIGEDLDDVVYRLVDVLSADAETLAVLAGEDLDDDGLERLEAHLSDAHPDLEIETHRGDQPLYPVILALE